MILLTRLNGDETYINPDLIERIEAHPDTVVTLLDGKKHVARETPHELIDRIVHFRAGILVAAEQMQDAFLRGGGASSVSARSTFASPTPRPLRLIDDQPGD
jgi:flagellar protein FlbD